MTQRFKILLYYKYAKITSPGQVMLKQRELCQKLSLKGRIIISKEGINGTIAGKPKDVNTYILATENIRTLSGMDWKVSWTDEEVFPKLKVIVRDEIVTLGLNKIGSYPPISKKAAYIEPEELYELYEKNADFIIVDTRNLYEANIGKFKNALISPITNFRDFPNFAKKLERYKEREVVTYCTGGIRCEKASAYLKTKGFKRVRQLHGGIHEYAQKTGGKYFEGEMFVFDKRLHVPVNKVDPTIISVCIYCQKPVTRLIDCAVSSCNSLFTCCNTCEPKYSGTCSYNCLEILENQKAEANAEALQFNHFL